MLKISLLIFSSLGALAIARGEIAINKTAYFQDKANQNSSSQFVKLQLQDEYKYKIYDFRFDLRARADQDDQTYLNLNEFNLSFNGPFVETYKIGYYVYNWSRLDTFHPANIINSRYINSDLEDVEKKGELSIILDNETILGNIKLFYFPKVQFNEYPSSSSRVMDGFSHKDNYVIDDYRTSKSNTADQYGISLQKQLGDVDFNLFYFNHIDRNNSVLGYHDYSYISNVGFVPIGNLAAYYARVNDFGLSSTFFLYEHTLKAEVVHSNFVDNERLFLTANGLYRFKDLTTLAFGHEYTTSLENGIDVTFFTEYQYVSVMSKSVQESSSVFENDLFIGQRVSFNDFSATELKYGIIYDMQRKDEWLAFINYDQRLNDAWKVKASFKFITHEEDDKKGLYLLKGDNELSLKLTRFF